MSKPTTVIINCRTSHGTPANGDRDGYVGHKRRKGSKVHLAVDSLSQFLAMVVKPANDVVRAKIGDLTKEILRATDASIEVGFVAQRDTGHEAEDTAASAGIRLAVVRLLDAQRGFVLLPRRWVVERSFGCLSRFRRLAKDYERLEETVTGMHLVAFSMLMLGRVMKLLDACSALHAPSKS